MTDPDDTDLEAPEEDAAEQAMSAFDEDDDEDAGPDEDEQDLEAPEWDVQEQHQSLWPSEDEYR
ncbi:hypothetical protein HH310_41535 [Actinoplanes sp. TBRC 11911]|uniref:hypothetical protein n=1 Tax=Actinoplanes sp. TBRC 11911 TaxID=2729386 RepID=UPI00145CF55E|nr:hypothetical protein [Actinoplanes sp. TBRC 11911]NMO57636.1 hypothetical protein [Actinoplanes sp. TBRC 11911]